MNTAVFTICSNNYLAQAKALSDSFHMYNKGVPFYICLVDRRDKAIDYDFLENVTGIIEIDKIGIPDYETFVSRYTIVELNTAVKPFFFLYLFDKYKELENIIYFDPDIYFFGSITKINNELEYSSVLLTPHLNYPAEGEFIYWERSSIMFGLYNLGFIGMHRDENTIKILNWWKYRTYRYCFHKLEAGMFVDQSWCSLIPTFFENVKISKNDGLNVAHWNLHERKFSKRNDEYYINKEKLIFFHFSSYNPLQKERVTAYDNIPYLPNADNEPIICEVFKQYRESLINNDYKTFSRIQCSYFHSHVNLTKDLSLKVKNEKKMKRYIKGLLYSFLYLKKK